MVTADQVLIIIIILKFIYQVLQRVPPPPLFGGGRIDTSHSSMTIWIHCWDDCVIIMMTYTSLHSEMASRDWIRSKTPIDKVNSWRNLQER